MSLPERKYMRLGKKKCGQNFAVDINFYNIVRKKSVF